MQQDIEKMVQSKAVMERNIHAYDEDEKWQLPEPAALMSAKAYKDKKAFPLVEKLKETIKALTIKCVQLAEQGKKVLTIDMDPQGNTTSGLGVDKNAVEDTLYELLVGQSDVETTIVKDVVENVDLIPSNVNLSGAEIELVGIDNKEYILKEITDKVKDNYDYIIIDCPPSLNMLTINALTAATSVLVPIQCEYYALEGLSQLIHTIDLVKDRLNNNLEIEGVVFTMYDARTNLSLQVVENVKENLQQNIYKTIIPRNVRLAEAPSYGQPITIYDPRSTGAESYRLLAEEVINREVE